MVDPDPAAPEQSGERSDRPRRRPHRRATGGSQPPPGGEPRGPKALDDTESAWGQLPVEDDDERIRREIPPHW